MNFLLNLFKRKPDHPVFIVPTYRKKDITCASDNAIHTQLKLENELARRKAEARQ